MPNAYPPLFSSSSKTVSCPVPSVRTDLNSCMDNDTSFQVIIRCEWVLFHVARSHSWRAVFPNDHHGLLREPLLRRAVPLWGEQPRVCVAGDAVLGHSHEARHHHGNHLHHSSHSCLLIDASIKPRKMLKSVHILIRRCKMWTIILWKQQPGRCCTNKQW